MAIILSSVNWATIESTQCFNALSETVTLYKEYLPDINCLFEFIHFKDSLKPITDLNKLTVHYLKTRCS